MVIFQKYVRKVWFMMIAAVFSLTNRNHDTDRCHYEFNLLGGQRVYLAIWKAADVLINRVTLNIFRRLAGTWMFPVSDQSVSLYRGGMFTSSGILSAVLVAWRQSRLV